MAGFPLFEAPGEVFLSRLAKLRHDIGMLRREPIVQLIERLHGRNDGCWDFEDSRFHMASISPFASWVNPPPEPIPVGSLPP